MDSEWLVGPSWVLNDEVEEKLTFNTERAKHSGHERHEWMRSQTQQRLDHPPSTLSNAGGFGLRTPKNSSKRSKLGLPNPVLIRASWLGTLVPRSRSGLTPAFATPKSRQPRAPGNVDSLPLLGKSSNTLWKHLCGHIKEDTELMAQLKRNIYPEGTEIKINRKHWDGEAQQLVNLVQEVR